MEELKRLTKHPVLEVKEREEISFYFNGQKCSSYKREVISSALFANGFQVFGRHHKDQSSQGIFCANGQCSQCTVIADGLSVKSCMTEVKEGMQVYSLDENPSLPDVDNFYPEFDEVEETECEVLIIGGGPSGIAAAIELGKLGKKVILADDKDSLGGKLILQTHSFFGSISDCYAGTRGIEIAKILSNELAKYPSVQVWLSTTVVGVYSDQKAGLVKDGRYFLVKPEKLLIACGAREKALSFVGCDLPGVYGAGAFQTLLNRDLVKPSEKLFIIGGGNVGIIAGYHALQAGIKVVGLVEAMPAVGGYKVHADKLKRFGVPIWTSHTVVQVNAAALQVNAAALQVNAAALQVNGNKEKVESITIAEIDKDFKVVAGTEKTFLVDTVLVAVGLNPIREIADQAKAFGMEVFLAGDAQEIAEASAAMFSGKIVGLEIAQSLGEEVTIPEEWKTKVEVLKSKPGLVHPHDNPTVNGQVFFPVFHCQQEIPCNPCTEVCPRNCITIKEGGLMGIPSFEGSCTGCGQCVNICPGLAITLVKPSKDNPQIAQVLVPFELIAEDIKAGDVLKAVDIDGNFLCEAKVTKAAFNKKYKRTILTLEVPKDIAVKVAGIQTLQREDPQEKSPVVLGSDEVIICRCERVTAGEIRRCIGDYKIRDLNQLKAILRCGMGACGGKTCEQLILRILKEEKVNADEIVSFTKRPLEMEVPLGVLAGDRRNV